MNGFTWSTPKIVGMSPEGRFSHMSRRHVATKKTDGVVSERILIYGGSQLGGKPSLYDAHELCVKQYSDTKYECEWTAPQIRGAIPDANRTGPATYFIGDKMLLIGGHIRSSNTGAAEAVATASANLESSGHNEEKTGVIQEAGAAAPRKSTREQLRVLAFDCSSQDLPPKWYEVQVLDGVFPTNRMSVGLTLKGTALLVSGGYETDGETARGKLLDKTDSWRLTMVPVQLKKYRMPYCTRHGTRHGSGYFCVPHRVYPVPVFYFCVPGSLEYRIYRTQKYLKILRNRTS